MANCNKECFPPGGGGLAGGSLELRSRGDRARTSAAAAATAVATAPPLLAGDPIAGFAPGGKCCGFPSSAFDVTGVDKFERGC